MRYSKTIAFLFITSLMMISTMLYAQDATQNKTDSAFATSIKSAMQSEIRTDTEKERDRNRRPVETLEFFGIESNMKVLELIPGGGWYTKLLAPALKD